MSNQRATPLQNDDNLPIRRKVHTFKTKLNGALITSELLIDQHTSDSKLIEFHEKIRESKVAADVLLRNLNYG